MSASSFGVNLRVTGHCSRGGRKYMEDFFSVAYQESATTAKDLEYAFIGIYDGHGGAEAAKFARQHLINMIVGQKLFWSEDDDEVLQAIREGYIATHYAMWREQEKWPKTPAGMLSTAGSTASVAFIRHSKIYIGHCGDSGIVLGYANDPPAATASGSLPPLIEREWRATSLTIDHKPESPVEKSRIQRSGGKVIVKSGVPRVVWNRPKPGHHGPVRRSTPIDEIPFLAVARSLGDFWSYNTALNKFVVSPDPDVRVIRINPAKFRCLIFGTDGLWNVVSPAAAVELVRNAEQLNQQNTYGGNEADWTNPSKSLVDRALEQWGQTRMRADNTSVVICMLDPPGPPRREVLRNSPQQFLVENEAYVAGQAGDNQTPQVLVNPAANCEIFGGPSVPQQQQQQPELLPAQSMAPMEAEAEEMPLPQQPPIPFGYTFDANGDATSLNLPYEYAYAAAFNPLIHPQRCDPIEPADAENAAAAAFGSTDETYSLTCLETRSSGATSLAATAAVAPPPAYYLPQQPQSHLHDHSFYDRPQPLAVAAAADPPQYDAHATPMAEYFAAAAGSVDPLPRYESIISGIRLQADELALDSSAQQQALQMMSIPVADAGVADAMDVNAFEVAADIEVSTEEEEAVAEAEEEVESTELPVAMMECDDEWVNDYLECYPDCTEEVAAAEDTPEKRSSKEEPEKMVEEEERTTEELPVPAAVEPISSQIAALLEASIQIHEVSSSSLPKTASATTAEKENHKSSTSAPSSSSSTNDRRTESQSPAPSNPNAASAPAGGGIYRMPMSLRSAKRSAMRMTRSSKLPRTPSFDSRTKKPKTIRKRSVAHKSPKCSQEVLAMLPSRLALPAKASASVSAVSAEAAASTQQQQQQQLGCSNRTLRSRNTQQLPPFSAAVASLASPIPASAAGSSARETRNTPSGGGSSSSTPNGRLRQRVKSQYQLLQSTRSGGKSSLVRTLSASARKLMAAVVSVAPSPPATGNRSDAMRRQTRGATSSGGGDDGFMSSLSCLSSKSKVAAASAVTTATSTSSRSRFRQRLSR